MLLRDNCLTGAAGSFLDCRRGGGGGSAADVVGTGGGGAGATGGGAAVKAGTAWGTGGSLFRCLLCPKDEVDRFLSPTSTPRDTLGSIWSWSAIPESTLSVRENTLGTAAGPPPSPPGSMAGGVFSPCDPLAFRATWLNVYLTVHDRM
jgi:hypothetical protein